MGKEGAGFKIAVLSFNVHLSHPLHVQCRERRSHQTDRLLLLTVISQRRSAWHVLPYGWMHRRPACVSFSGSVHETAAMPQCNRFPWQQISLRLMDQQMALATISFRGKDTSHRHFNTNHNTLQTHLLGINSSGSNSNSTRLLRVVYFNHVHVCSSCCIFSFLCVHKSVNVYWDLQMWKLSSCFACTDPQQLHSRHTTRWQKNQRSLHVTLLGCTWKLC